MIGMVATVVLIFIISLVFSMFGKGGGELYLPVMLTLLNIEFYTAAGVSLFIIFLQSISMIFIYSQKHKLVDWLLAIVLASVVGISSFIGGFFSKTISALFLKITFAVLLILSAVFLVMNKKVKVEHGIWFWHRRFAGNEYATHILYLILTVGIIGFFAGMVGISGGGLIVPVAVILGGVPIRIAMGTNTVLVLVSSSMGFLGHLAKGGVNWSLCGILGTSVIVGSQMGSRMHAKVSEKSLRIGLAIILTFAALWMIVRVLR